MFCVKAGKNAPETQQMLPKSYCCTMLSFQSLTILSSFHWR